MKIIALTIQMRRTNKKLVTQNISQRKETLSQKLGFWKSNCTDTFEQVPPCTIILVQNWFFNLTIWTPMAQAFQNTLTFDRCFFNSRSNFYVNLVHWNSLHPKNAILPTFFGHTPHFLCHILYCSLEIIFLRYFWCEKSARTHYWLYRGRTSKILFK